jgi:hypothetical protein
MMVSVEMSLVAAEMVASTSRMMLNGWKKAFHKSNHHGDADL